MQIRSGAEANGSKLEGVCSTVCPETALWTPLEQGLNEWDDLCMRMDASSPIAPPTRRSDASNRDGAPAQAPQDQDSVHSTLRAMAKMLARSQHAQALHGRTTTLLARQVVSCLRGTEADTLAKTVQGVRECADWAQQVHQLNTELKVQRYAWQQLHSQLMQSQAAAQNKDEDLLAKEQELLQARTEAESLRHQQGNRSEGTRHLLKAKEQEVEQLQAELEQRDAECAHLRRRAQSVESGAGLLEAHVRERLDSGSCSGSSDGGYGLPGTMASDSSAQPVLNEVMQVWKEKLKRKTVRIIANLSRAKDAELDSLREQLAAMQQQPQEQRQRRSLPLGRPPARQGDSPSVWHSEDDAETSRPVAFVSAEGAAAGAAERMRGPAERREGLAVGKTAPSDATLLDSDISSAVPPTDLADLNYVNVASAQLPMPDGCGNAGRSGGGSACGNGSDSGSGSNGQRSTRQPAKEQQFRRQLVRSLEALRQKLCTAAAAAAAPAAAAVTSTAHRVLEPGTAAATPVSARLPATPSTVQAAASARPMAAPGTASAAAEQLPSTAGGAGAASPLAAGAPPPGDLSQEQQWRSHGMAWVAHCMRELSSAADIVARRVTHGGGGGTYGSAERPAAAALMTLALGLERQELQAGLTAARQEMRVLESSVGAVVRSDRERPDLRVRDVQAAAAARDVAAATARQAVLVAEAACQAELAEQRVRAALERALRAETALATVQQESRDAASATGRAAVQRVEAELAESRTQLAEARQLLAEAGAQLMEARRQLAGSKVKLVEAETRLVEARQQLTDTVTQLAEAEMQLVEARQQVTDTRKQLAEAETQLVEARQQLEKTRKQLADGIASAEVERQLLGGRLLVMSNRAEVAEAKQGKTSGRLSRAEAELAEARRQLHDSFPVLDAVRASEAALKEQVMELQCSREILEHFNPPPGREKDRSQESSPTPSAIAARLAQAEATVASERELSESLGEEVEKLQARLVALQQEHSSLKREAAMLAERAAMSEEGREEARLTAEAITCAAQERVDAVERELEAAQRLAQEVAAEAAATAAADVRQRIAVRSGRVSHTGRGEVADAGDGAARAVLPSPHQGPTGSSVTELLEAKACISAMEQELQATKARLADILAAGRAECEDEMSGAAAAGMPAAAGLQALLGVLSCTELMYTQEEMGTSLGKIRMLQAQLESGLQVALQGTGSEPPALLKELQSLRELQQRHEGPVPHASSDPWQQHLQFELTTLKAEQQVPGRFVESDLAFSSRFISAEEDGLPLQHQVEHERWDGQQGEPWSQQEQRGDEWQPEAAGGASAYGGKAPELEQERLQLPGTGWGFSSRGSSGTRAVPSQLASSIGGGRCSSSVSVNGGSLEPGDDMMDGIDAWELPPLPPPPCFD